MSSAVPPPGAWPGLVRFWAKARQPIDRFLQIEAASGILLLVAAAAALIWANSAWAASYDQLWHTSVGLRVGAFSFERSLEWIVNDGLMVIFFFVVGLEIRREIHSGELSEWRRAAMPVIAAVGGMLVPAGIYLLIAGKPETHHGWGVPMATDIAFAVGILALLGKRVPPALRVLLLALAVIDDLGAILVIALFYSDGIAVNGLLVALGALLVIWLMQRSGIRAKSLYVAPAVVAWAGVYAAGIHPTIAGVVVGLMTPVQAWDAHEADSPANELIDDLHGWVAYFIMPVFALANAGVVVSLGAMGGDSALVIAAVVAGLVIGKPVGVLAACWVTAKLGVGVLPRGVTARHLVVLGLVAGIGFTMALFIANLAFARSEPALLDAAKLGILLASGVAGVGALLVGRFLLGKAAVPGAAVTATDAEQSTEL